MEGTRPSKRGDLALAHPMGWLVLGWLLPLLAMFHGMVVQAVSPAGSVDTLRLAVEADPHSLDPAQVFSNEEAMLCFLMFHNLLDPNPEGGFVPVLAESLPVTSLDGLTHTFVLKQGVRCSDGEELVADDVVYTFERYFDPQAFTVNGAYFRAIKGSKEFNAARVQETAARDPSRSNGERWIQPLTVPGIRALDRYTVQIDKEQLVRILANRCVVARGPLPLAVRGFNQGLTAYPHDPAKARALLAQAGLTHGFESTLWTNRDDPRWVKIALFVQQSLKEYGIRLEIREVGYPTLVELCGKRRNVPMGVFDWVSAADDPKEILDSLLNGDNILDENCVNVAFYSNPRAQQLFRDAVAEANPNRRQGIYRQIESIVVEDVPWIFLVQFNTEVLVQPWVKGFKPRGFWPPARFDSTWIER